MCIRDSSDDAERGGKLATFVLHMAEDTNLVGASISNYVWAFRSWLKFTAAAPAAATPSSTGTRIPNRTRIEVDWSGEWYSGLTTSQRTQGSELLTRVLYDAARGHKAQACYHNLDLEHWWPEAAQ